MQHADEMLKDPLAVAKRRAMADMMFVYGRAYAERGMDALIEELKRNPSTKALLSGEANVWVGRDMPPVNPGGENDTGESDEEETYCYAFVDPPRWIDDMNIWGAGNDDRAGGMELCLNSIAALGISLSPGTLQAFALVPVGDPVRGGEEKREWPVWFESLRGNRPSLCGWLSEKSAIYRDWYDSEIVKWNYGWSSLTKMRDEAAWAERDDMRGLPEDAALAKWREERGRRGGATDIEAETVKLVESHASLTALVNQLEAETGHLCGQLRERLKGAGMGGE